MAIKDQTNFASGALFLVIGTGCAVLSLGYKLGTPARMGSGFFPLCLGVILAVLGIVLIVQSCSANSPIDRLTRWRVRAAVIIFASVLAFALLLPTIGLVAAIIGLVLVSSFAAHDFKWSVAVINAAFLAALCCAIFVFGLGLPLQIWPSFG